MAGVSSEMECRAADDSLNSSTNSKSGGCWLCCDSDFNKVAARSSNSGCVWEKLTGSSETSRASSFATIGTRQKRCFIADLRLQTLFNQSENGFQTQESRGGCSGIGIDLLCNGPASWLRMLLPVASSSYTKRMHCGRSLARKFSRPVGEKTVVTPSIVTCSIFVLGAKVSGQVVLSSGVDPPSSLPA